MDVAVCGVAYSYPVTAACKHRLEPLISSIQWEQRNYMVFVNAFGLACGLLKGDRFHQSNFTQQSPCFFSDSMIQSCPLESTHGFQVHQASVNDTKASQL